MHSGILFLLFFASLRTAKNIQIVAGHFIFSQTVCGSLLEIWSATGGSPAHWCFLFGAQWRSLQGTLSIFLINNVMLLNRAWGLDIRAALFAHFSPSQDMASEDSSKTLNLVILNKIMSLIYIFPTKIQMNRCCAIRLVSMYIIRTLNFSKNTSKVDKAGRLIHPRLSWNWNDQVL